MAFKHFMVKLSATYVQEQQTIETAIMQATATISVMYVAPSQFARGLAFHHELPCTRRNLYMIIAPKGARKCTKQILMVMGEIQAWILYVVYNIHDTSV